MPMQTEKINIELRNRGQNCNQLMAYLKWIVIIVYGKPLELFLAAFEFR